MEAIGDNLYAARDSSGTPNSFRRRRISDYPLRLFKLDGTPVEPHLAEFSTIKDVVSKIEPVKFSFEEGGRQGVCNILGEKLIAPLYKKILSFNGGYYIAVSAERSSIIFLSEDGRHLGELGLPSYWIAPEGFSEGLLRGVSPNLGPIFLRPDASLLSTPKLLDASSFSCGFAAVVLAGDMFKTDCAAFMDKDGHLLANKKFASTQSFVNDRAIVGVRLPGADRLRMGVVNLKGDYVVEPIWDTLIVNDDHTYLARNILDDGTAGGDLLLDAVGSVICRYDHRLTISPGQEIPQLASDHTKQAQLKLPEKSSPRVSVDRSGHIFDCDHWPADDVIAPVTDVASSAALDGLRSAQGWVTRADSIFYQTLPGRRWLARKLR